MLQISSNEQTRTVKYTGACLVEFYFSTVGDFVYETNKVDLVLFKNEKKKNYYKNGIKRIYSQNLT